MNASIVKRIVLGLGLVVLGIGSTMAGYAIFMHRNPIAAITQIFVPTPLQVFGKPNILVLVEGLDYDYTSTDQEFSTNSRSDAIWAVNLDFTNERIFQLSILRDTVATMPNGSQAKINEAQSEGGVNEARSVIAQFLGIPGFDRYVILRIDATREFVDAIGGVNVDVKSSDCFKYKTGCTGETLNYDDSWGHLHIHLKEGMQHLDGPNAVAYMRFRHDWCSDPCRVMRQQQVLHAMIDKLKGDRVNTMIHLPDLLRVFKKYVQTDFTDAELLSLANYYQGMSQNAIVSNQVPYTGDIDLPGYGDSLVPDAQARDKLVESMLLAPPVPEPSPDAMALAAIAPGTLRVDVENGSGIDGAAKRIADRLKHAGFVIGSVGDASRTGYATTEIHEHSTVAFAGAKIRAALPAGKTEVIPDPSPAGSPAPDASATTSDVTVIVGEDLAKLPRLATQGLQPQIR
ncbi:MAG TPA: LCP family protein [Candidatus Baltobacteraceae bacterium]|nr:LCP family protein [Candidatus Baltobacteraceae bacterium]